MTQLTQHPRQLSTNASWEAIRITAALFKAYQRTVNDPNFTKCQSQMRPIEIRMVDRYPVANPQTFRFHGTFEITRLHEQSSGAFNEESYFSNGLESIRYQLMKALYTHLPSLLANKAFSTPVSASMTFGYTKSAELKASCDLTLEAQHKPRINIVEYAHATGTYATGEFGKLSKLIAGMGDLEQYEIISYLSSPVHEVIQEFFAKEIIRRDPQDWEVPILGHNPEKLFTISNLLRVGADGELEPAVTPEDMRKYLNSASSHYWKTAQGDPLYTDTIPED